MIIYDLLIKNARIIDPSCNMDETGDLLIADGRINKIGRDFKEAAHQTIDATGLIACPGFIDLHCHLRQPGFEHKETIATGSAAASRGGFTSICCMPNTDPAIDNATTVSLVKKIAAAEAPEITILPIGCITVGRAGNTITDIHELYSAGCAGFSDDGCSVASPYLLAQAMETAASTGLPIIEHCEDADLARNGQMNDGWVAARLGLKGIPAAAEETIVARDIMLAEMTGARLHLTHISTSGSVELVRSAKRKGLKVTADVTPHHLTLTEERVIKGSLKSSASPAYDTNAKINPPLRTANDIKALVAGLTDGTIDAIATDHAPHAEEDKLCEFESAAFGITGFETAFGVLMSLVHEGMLSLKTLISCLTWNPARILEHMRMDIGTLATGSYADIALLDLDHEWTVDLNKMLSKGKNMPYTGRLLKGIVIGTIYHGSIASKADILKVTN